MQKFNFIPESDWQKAGVEPLDTTNTEDGGYRTCPSCQGLAYTDRETVNCETCHGEGTVQWSWPHPQKHGNL